MKAYIEDNFAYNLNESLAQIRTYYKFDETCPGSVPQSIRAFLESNDYEDAIRRAISIGGDSDIIACITLEGSQRLIIKRYPILLSRE